MEYVSPEAEIFYIGAPDIISVSPTIPEGEWDEEL